MANIVLLTDFGFRDEYVGIVKGVILKINPQAQILDLTHEIPPQDVAWTAYCLASAYKFFSKETIFLCVVDPGVGTKRKIIIVKTKDYFFVAPDNGILTRVLEKDNPEKIIAVRNKKFFLPEISSTFHGRDIMAPVAAYLSRGVALSEFGPEIKMIKKIALPEVIIKDKCISGEIIHIDHFGNLITNIDKNFFAQVIKKNKFFIKIKDKKIFRINTSYSQSKKGELLAIWGSRNLLEIAVSQGSAVKELRIKKGEQVTINLIIDA
ncbi:MAG: SAM-dependent chlorinase/fluorinase [Candidatus Omnitrophica bacterium]|nr:SAM-dependent chlorinase/fluorinase [Candidatus Omnitrophota bacterium]